jgi:hypothetical protein
MKDIRHLGLDVDSEKIAVAVAEPEGEVRSLGTIPYCDDAVRRLVKKLGWDPRADFGSATRRDLTSTACTGS